MLSETRCSEVDCNRGLEIGRRWNCIVCCWRRMQRWENAILAMLADEALLEGRWRTSFLFKCVRCARKNERYRLLISEEARSFFPQLARALVLGV